MIICKQNFIALLVIGSISPEAWQGDKQVESTISRNERQWFAISKEELTEIIKKMGLTQALTSACLM